MDSIWDIKIPKDRQRFDATVDCSICKDSCIESALKADEKQLFDHAFQYLSRLKWHQGSCGHKMHEICIFMELRREIIEKINREVHAPFRRPSEASGVVVDLHSKIEEIWRTNENMVFCRSGCGRDSCFLFEDIYHINLAIRKIPFTEHELLMNIANVRLFDLVVGALDITIKI
ncbi:MAG: hypothetical protein AAGH46_13205 [Bacteroidota bacterium]